MDSMEAMACPVCTLYLREGMSMQSHLNTHPKDQVIEALVRLYSPQQSQPQPPPPSSSMPPQSFIQVNAAEDMRGAAPVYQHVTFTAYQPQSSPQHQQPSYEDYVIEDTPKGQLLRSSPGGSGGKSEDSENFRDVQEDIGKILIADSKSEVYIREEYVAPPSGTEPLSPVGSTHSSGIAVRTDLTVSNAPQVCDHYITSDCDYQDEDARDGDDIINIEARDPIGFEDDEDMIGSRVEDEINDAEDEDNEEDAVEKAVDIEDLKAVVREKVDVLDNIGGGHHQGAVNSCSGGTGTELDIQADERMPARGELSGQGSLCNTLWLPEETPPMVTSIIWDEREVKKLLPPPLRIVQRSYQCLYCGQTFQCPKERRVHIASVHSNSKSSTNVDIPAQPADEVVTAEVDTSSVGCTKCGLQVTSPKQLKEHIKLIHKRADRSCGVCGQTFADKRTYEEHLSKVHPLECTVCGKTFHSKAGLVLHTKIHMAVKPHPCDACDKSFVTAQKLREHQNTHTGFAPLQCNMCDRKFKRYSNLKQHKDIAHFKLKKKTKDFFCECGETFQSKKKLAWHQETHLEKPKQCPYCSERYIHSASLTRHIRKAHDNRYLPSEDGTVPSKGEAVPNTKAKNVQCPVCNLVFLESSLRAHMRQHTPQPKQYGCIICGKRFHTKWNLHLHRWTHASRLSKPFKCTMCKGAFIRLTDLQAHVRAHYGQKPFTCNHCGMQFNRKNNWHRHEKEHTSMKKYTCEECGKTFHRNYYLVEHSRIHTGVKPYSCHICNKTSATKSNHNKHLRTHHARETVNTEG